MAGGPAPHADAGGAPVDLAPPATRRSPSLAPSGVLALVAVLLLGQHARASGSRPLLVLVAGVALALLLDGAWAFLPLRRVDLRVRRAPDAVVGRRTPIELDVARPRARLVLRMSSLVEGDLVAIEGPGPVTLQIVPDERGVFPAAVFEATTRGPLGFVQVRRRVGVALADPVHVAPAPLPVPGLVDPPSTGWSAPDATRAAPAPRTGELTRGVRAWEPGDGRRRVHWPATARTGALMARDLEDPSGDELVVVVDLGPTPSRAAEQVASMAMWVVADALVRGVRVALVTREPAGAVDAPVADARAAGRRLAAAVTGPPTPFTRAVDPRTVLHAGPPPPAGRDAGRAVTTGPSPAPPVTWGTPPAPHGGVL